MILGCSYDALSEAVLAEWKIPDVIMRAQRPLPRRHAEGGASTAANGCARWRRSAWTWRACWAAAPTRPARRKRSALLARYGRALNLDATAAGRAVRRGGAAR